MASQFEQELTQAGQLYDIVAENAQSYADLLLHMLHEYAHSNHSVQLFQMLARHLTATDASNESQLQALYQECTFELFPALVTAFNADPTAISAVSVDQHRMPMTPPQYRRSMRCQRAAGRGKCCC